MKIRGLFASVIYIILKLLEVKCDMAITDVLDFGVFFLYYLYILIIVILVHYSCDHLRIF